MQVQRFVAMLGCLLSLEQDRRRASTAFVFCFSQFSASFRRFSRISPFLPRDKHRTIDRKSIY
jgi:hypothetical protein